MKKIGILTTYFATNFGAMLQSFALKRTLEQMGFDVEVIRYKQPKVYYTYKPFKWRRLISKNPLLPIKYVFSQLPIMLRKAKKYEDFQLKHIQHVKGFADYIPVDKDFYIFGSDQIWNPKITGGFDDIYFGNFKVNVGAKRIAYAASAESIEYTKEQCEYLRRGLKNFDAISVREAKLADDLKKVTSRDDIVNVIDPTLLANPSIYQEIKHINPLPGKKYVLFYKIRNCIRFVEKIYKYAVDHGLEMVILSSWLEGDLFRFTKTHSSVTYLPEAGIEIFLGAIENAEIIFTPSFHGCVFPIIYHKPFYSLVLDDTWNTRAIDLLSSLDLGCRLLKLDDIIKDNPINYSEVDKLLFKRKQFSKKFLVNSLK